VTKRAFAPHCDQAILHAPGVCKYCDGYPDWQEHRQVARINFTGEHEPDKAPCPSLMLRDDETRDRWPNNRAVRA